MNSFLNVSTEKITGSEYVAFALIGIIVVLVLWRSFGQNWTDYLIGPPHSDEPTAVDCVQTASDWEMRAEWPLDEVEVGATYYTQEEAVALFARPAADDVTYGLAQALIVAKLNIADGVEQLGLVSQIAAADEWLVVHPVGSRPENAEEEAKALQSPLEAFNAGETSIPLCSAVEEHTVATHEAPPPVEDSATVDDHEKGDEVAADVTPELELFEIEGMIWFDGNGNNERDKLEVGLEGVNVVLTNEEGWTQSRVSAADGKYSFSGLRAGSYNIAVEPMSLPSGLVPTGEARDVGNQHAGSIELVSGEPSTEVSFGYGRAGSTACENLHMLVIDNSRGRIVRFDMLDGAFVDEFGTGEEGYQEGAIGPDGYLYVSNGMTNQILRFDYRTGALFDVFASEEDGLNRPSGLTFDDKGVLYVNNTGMDSVLRHNGDTFTTFVSFRSGGLINPLEGLSFGPDGSLYVASGNTDEVLRYDGNTGAFIDVFIPAGSGTLDFPGELVFLDDALYVSSLNNDKILQYNAYTGAFEGVTADMHDHRIDQPVDFAFNEYGHLYVASAMGLSEIHQYGDNDVYLGLFNESELVSPKMLFFDCMDDVAER